MYLILECGDGMFSHREYCSSTFTEDAHVIKVCLERNKQRQEENKTKEDYIKVYKLDSLCRVTEIKETHKETLAK